MFHRRKGHSNGNGGTTLLIGLGVGYAAGLLLAPMSGRKLRRRLERAGKRAGNSASESVIALRERGEIAVERMGDALETTRDGFRGFARSISRR